VRDVLVRVGGVADPDVRAARALPESGFRTTLRAAVEDGRAGFRRHRSHEITVVDECLVADPLAAQLLVEGRFGTAREVTIRVGARTGERLVVVDPTAEGVRLPDDVTVVGTDELAAGRRAWYHEEVAGRRWRISAASFFQGRPDAADELVAVVRSAIGERSAPPVLVDAYCGVGLFGGSLPSTRVIAVESSASSAADARHNLAHLDAKVVRTKVERWRPSPADVVVADPARRGLHPVRALERLVGTGADVFVLVSCDAGSLGRDVARLVAAGYEHRASTLVDSFPHTAHVEVVTELVASPLR
jgi:23S rRNA (uracil1939-C5)-methyltransferase